MFRIREQGGILQKNTIFDLRSTARQKMHFESSDFAKVWEPEPFWKAKKKQSLPTTVWWKGQRKKVQISPFLMQRSDYRPEHKYSTLLMQRDTKTWTPEKSIQTLMANGRLKRAMSSFGNKTSDEQKRLPRHHVWKLTEQQERAKKCVHIHIGIREQQASYQISLLGNWTKKTKLLQVRMRNVRDEFWSPAAFGRRARNCMKKDVEIPWEFTRKTRNFWFQEKHTASLSCLINNC